jgi:uncharacterized protein (DUF488 family)
VRIHTIGFTQRSAESFFSALSAAGIGRVLDVRLYNVSQLAGFTKKNDLRFFLRKIGDMAYEHDVRLAPTEAMLKSYRSHEWTWGRYEEAFMRLMTEREVDRLIERHSFEIPTALLCSELTATKCHRRLVAEFLRDRWGNVEIVHL